MKFFRKKKVQKLIKKYKLKVSLTCSNKVEEVEKLFESISKDVYLSLSTDDLENKTKSFKLEQIQGPTGNQGRLSEPGNNYSNGCIAEKCVLF